MTYQLRRSADEGIPAGAIRSPDDDDIYLAINDSEALNAFGFAVSDDGDVEAWFPWGGDEVHKKGDDFSFMVKDPDYTYKWVLVRKYMANRDEYRPLTEKNDNDEDITPASFAGRLGKINLSNMNGMTCFDGKENIRSPEEVQQAKILCIRRKHDQCHVEYVPSRVGAYPRSDAVRAKHSKYKSFVVLSTDYEPPQFGRASLNKFRDGLQAWFPYGGEEVEKDDFQVLCGGECADLYWAPIREVHEDPKKHELVKLGMQSPAVLNGILGKAHIESLQGWVSEGGEEMAMEGDQVLDGTVLCFRDKDCDEHQ